MRRPFVVFALSLAVGCGSNDPAPASSERRGAPPPPKASVATSGSACVASPPADAPTKGFFPDRVGDLCLQQESATYGKDAKSPISGICDLFDGECQLYLDLAIDRAIEIHYAAPGGATITARLSRFDSAEHAYAMFTTRVVGDSDPALDSTPKPLALGAGQLDAGLGVGNVVFVKGLYLFEADFKDSSKDLAGLTAGANAALPELAKKVSAALPAGDPPALVAALPEADRIPLGVRYDAGDALKIKGAGPAMLGYHKTTDGRRYRTLVSKSADAKHAEHVFKVLTAHAIDPVGAKDTTARAEVTEGALKLEWVFHVEGPWVIGVGDESRVLRAGITGPAHDDLCLPLDKKKATEEAWAKNLSK